MESKTRREEIIENLMKYSGMTRKDAEFAADVELGKYPTGDVITKESEGKHKK